jgi:sulfatase maturation enzyme AslB (radical SAM superfamily)
MHVTNDNLDCCFLTLFVHNLCNYDCSYCDAYHKDGKFRWSDNWDPYINLVNKLKEKHKYLYVDIMGGEPTLWPKFQQFIDTISDNNVLVEYSTNASRTLRYWQNFKSQKTFVFLSWHYEFANDEHFYNVAKIMQDKASISIPLMIVPENFERAKKLFNKLSDLNVEITPKFTRKKIGGIEYFDYTDEQREWVTKSYYNKMKPLDINWKLPQELIIDSTPMKFMKILDNNLHRFKGFKCVAGIKRVVVDSNGDVFRCNKRVGGPLGNILSDNYVLPEDPVICTIDACPCKADAIVEKWK